MQHLGARPKTGRSPRHPDAVRARVRFLAYHRIKPHVPPLVRAPVNSFERLRRGLPGYLILFDPRAFVHQRQSRPREVPSQSAFCVISMHFTATPRIPPTAAESQNRSPGGTPRVEPALFTTGLRNSLRTL